VKPALPMALSRAWHAATLLLLVGRPALAGADTVKVKITTPTRGATAMGPTVVAAEVVADGPVLRVVFQSDATGPVTVTAPPYSPTPDLGGDSRNHRFLVTAFTANAKGSAMVDTVGLRVDDQVDIALRQIFATVSRGDQRVTDLGRDAIALYDEGTKQNLVT